MKATKKYLILPALALMASAGVLTSCNGDEAMPPMPLPDELFKEVVGENGEVIGREIGNGTWENPLNAYQTRIGTLPEGMEECWITGYIVGYVDSSSGEVMNAEICKLQIAAGAPNSNFLLADSPDETDWTKCCAVNLPYEVDGIRNALSLQRNPDLLGKRVSLYGTTGVRYFGVYGMKGTRAWVIGSDEGYEIPPVVKIQMTPLLDVPADGGQIAIVADKQVAKPIAANYGWIYVSEGLFRSGRLIVDSSYAYTFEPKDGKFRIRQSDGRYLIQKSSNQQNFDISESGDEAGALFTVTIDEEGNAHIVNAVSGGTIQYNASKSSYGCYKTIGGDYTLPKLYIKAQN